MAKLSDDETLELAKAFNVPVIINSDLRDGSLRECANNSKCKILLYEAGEALRFDEFCIRAGERGVINVLRYLGLIKPQTARAPKRIKQEPVIAQKSHWLRATSSGLVNNKVTMGETVEKGEILAEINNPFGEKLDVVVAKQRGIVIGKQNIPLVQEGDAMFHIALFDELEEATEVIEHYEEVMMPEDESIMDH